MRPERLYLVGHLHLARLFRRSGHFSDGIGLMNTTVILTLAGLMGAAGGVVSVMVPSVLPSPATAHSAPSATFSLCHFGGGVNCVVDGDTIWLDGTKIRVADIDAPETHPPRCTVEANLGTRATQRLQELVNAGPFVVRQAQDGRDEDRYGRKLRVLERDSQSLGAVLVSEGLARRWTGHREPWC